MNSVAARQTAEKCGDQQIPPIIGSPEAGPQGDKPGSIMNSDISTDWSQLNLKRAELGVIVVDHGSRRAESNDMLLQVVAMFERLTGYEIVEPAHMELAEPSIATAFDRCVERGARTIVCFPYFLLPGKHWDKDIPALTQAAADKHPGVRWMVTSPLGLHDLMARIMDERIRHCLARVEDRVEECPSCAGTGKCRMNG
jgi:sirohydrochlorin ferrochelatase